MCEKALAARFPAFPAKIASWSPSLNVSAYRKVRGWKRDNASLRFKYEDSMVIMGPILESEAFNRWYGAATCYFGREGSSMRLLMVCATGTQAGFCRVPNPIVRKADNRT
ncbi:MAG: hypothetical protein K2Z80_30740 [Xanthobacteraceae bacterium]|nr:hypothetical protein [Xanthobacteraceae bacterium]